MGMRFSIPSWFLRLAGGLMTGNISFAGAQTVDGVDISDLALKVGRLKFGTFTGDGAASQNITTVGFTPDVIMAAALLDANCHVFLWVPGMAADTAINISSPSYKTDHIKSTLANGFQIGDGTGDQNRLNVAARPGIYICLKQGV